MIFYLVTAAGDHTVSASLPHCGAELRARLQVMTYERLFRSARIPAGSYVFSDIERLTPHQAERAALAWRALAESGLPVRLFNHPTRSMRRYELLRSLCERGINDFDVYRLVEMRSPRRWPVFLRRENGHEGALSPLLDGPDALARAIEAALAAGNRRGELLVVEFCDTRRPDGAFRKYGAYVAGDAIVPTHIYVAAAWMQKPDNNWQVAGTAVDAAAAIEEEVRFLAENPHADQLRAIARLARIEYGRFDYGLKDGRVQVWELNTNPDTAIRPYVAANSQNPARDDRVVPQAMANVTALLAGLDCAADPRATLRLPWDADQAPARLRRRAADAWRRWRARI